MPCTGSCVGGELMQVGLVSRKGRASSGPCFVRSRKLCGHLFLRGRYPETEVNKQVSGHCQDIDNFELPVEDNNNSAVTKVVEKECHTKLSKMASLPIFIPR